MYNGKYDLTPEQFQRNLGAVELELFMGGRRVAENYRPYSVYVVAQPGAGKTALRSAIEVEYQSETADHPFVEFNPDDVAIRHEYYREILKEYPDESYQILQKFVSPALDNYLKPKAVELRSNIIQEGTLANTDAYIKILDFQKNGGKAEIGEVQEDGTRKEVDVNGGYFIDINVLAVDRYESLLSSYEREQEFRELGLPPRAVTEANHDSSYDKILNTINEIENRKLGDRIRIYRRGIVKSMPILVYDTGRANSSMTAVEKIKEERANNRKELMINPQKYLSRISALRDRVKENGTKIQMEKIDKLEKQFMAELQKNKERNDEER